MAYSGGDVSLAAPNGQAQPDAQGCQAFCMSTYETAKYFEWSGPPVSSGNCWCKHSNSRRSNQAGVISGEATCDKEVRSCPGN